MIAINIGDIVIDRFGKTGVIDMICDCEQCSKRGFFEPHVIYNEDNNCGAYITDTDMKNDFSEFYKIGNNIWPDHINETELHNYINSNICQIAELLDNIKLATILIETLKEG